MESLLKSFRTLKRQFQSTERLFSGAVQIITLRRNCLIDEHFEMMLSLIYNY